MYLKTRIIFLKSIFHIKMKPGLNIQQGEYLLFQEVERLKNEKITAKELEKSINQLSSTLIFGLKSKQKIAESLGMNQILFGNYKHFFTIMERYQAVTIDDVQRSVRKYFVNSKKNTIYLKPLRRKTMVP